jgi:hypothetical protein
MFYSSISKTNISLELIFDIIKALKIVTDHVFITIFFIAIPVLYRMSLQMLIINAPYGHRL